MKINKQIIKKINSPKMFFVFILLVILSIIVIHFLFQSVRVIFDMDKKAETKMADAKMTAHGNTKPT
jgi:Na+-transporting methylmalonyl-CoA/oxaloacetate decarboxylase gamma subunit